LFSCPVGFVLTPLNQYKVAAVLLGIVVISILEVGKLPREAGWPAVEKSVRPDQQHIQRLDNRYDVIRSGLNN
jgi:hypothetical protein